jgi:hypothetical protein
VTTEMLLATSISGVGMRVAVTTMVSGLSSAEAAAMAAQGIRGREANRKRKVDLRTRFSRT